MLLLSHNAQRYTCSNLLQPFRWLKSGLTLHGHGNDGDEKHNLRRGARWGGLVEGDVETKYYCSAPKKATASIVRTRTPSSSAAPMARTDWGPVLGKHFQASCRGALLLCLFLSPMMMARASRGSAWTSNHWDEAQGLLLESCDTFRDFDLDIWIKIEPLFHGR